MINQSKQLSSSAKHSHPFNTIATHSMLPAQYENKVARKRKRCRRNNGGDRRGGGGRRSTARLQILQPNATSDDDEDEENHKNKWARTELQWERRKNSKYKLHKIIKLPFSWYIARTQSIAERWIIFKMYMFVGGAVNGDSCRTERVYVCIGERDEARINGAQIGCDPIILFIDVSNWNI